MSKVTQKRLIGSAALRTLLGYATAFLYRKYQTKLKRLTEKNTLVYYGTELTTNVKSFIE
jgi:hypothetical protein